MIRSGGNGRLGNKGWWKRSTVCVSIMDHPLYMTPDLARYRAHTASYGGPRSSGVDTTVTIWLACEAGRKEHGASVCVGVVEWTFVCMCVSFSALRFRSSPPHGCSITAVFVLSCQINGLKSSYIWALVLGAFGLSLAYVWSVHVKQALCVLMCLTRGL